LLAAENKGKQNIMTTDRRELRKSILSVFDTCGALFTTATETPPEDMIADLAIDILCKKRKPRKKPANDYTPLAYALADVCAIDFKSNKPILFAEAKRLSVATPAPTSHLVKLHYGVGGSWYTQDWRGKKGNRPTLGQVRLTWVQLVASDATEQGPRVIKVGQ